DRARTTMSAFALCDACQREHDDWRDRRFHAQTITCPLCGPTPRFDGVSERAIENAADAIRRGAIVAVQGLGGFHLAVDARSASAVDALRARKHRPDEPFAIMVADLASARALASVSEVEARLLGEGFVVLCAGHISERVAPGLTHLGLLL